MNRIRILVFPCGSEIGIEIHRALKDIPFITLVGASSAPDHGKFLYENYYEDVPYCNESGFIKKINDIIKKENIDFIFPALDDVISILSQYRENLYAELLTSPNETVNICRSKRLTYLKFKDMDFTPFVYANIEEIMKYPVIIKPSVGYGSRGFMKIVSKNELLHQLSVRGDEQVICEYLCGEEYTIDCFTNRKGELQYISSRVRNRVKNGISVNSIIQPLEEDVEIIANQINEELELKGAWFFQLKKDYEGKLKLLEIAPRIAGTMCIQRAAGVNLALLTVYDAMGYDVSIEKQLNYVEVDRALYNNFKLPCDFSELYIDFDDTIIVNEKVNTSVMQLLYQCINKEIPIYLVTKHRGKLSETLEKYKISEKIFNKIIHINPLDQKGNYISPAPDAIFIDDSFSERQMVSKQFGIITLGIDSVEVLLDWKR